MLTRSKGFVNKDRSDHLRKLVKLMIYLVVASLLLLTLVSSGQEQAEAGVFDTIADRVLGQAGFQSRDSGSATNQMNQPVGVVVDRSNTTSQGRIYVADWQNHRVLWRLDAQIFSNGASPTFVITNSPELEATSVATDSSGRLYVTDYEHNRVLRFPNPSTSVPDIALGQSNLTDTFQNGPGGTPNDNTLYSPWSIAIDNNDNLFVADTYNHRVLAYRKPASDFTTGMKADLVLGQSSFTANLPPPPNGVTASNLHFPRGVSVDESGNLYVADTENNRILRFNNPLGSATNGMAATLVLGQTAFTGSAPNAGGSPSDIGLWRPYGLAVDTGAQWLYVADTSNNRVVGFKSPFSNAMHATILFGQPTFSATAGNRDNVTHPQADSLYQPYGVAADLSGDLYVTDTFNHRVLGYDGVFCCAMYLPLVRR